MAHIGALLCRTVSAGMCVVLMPNLILQLSFSTIATQEKLLLLGHSLMPRIIHSSSSSSSSHLLVKPVRPVSRMSAAHSLTAAAMPVVYHQLRSKPSP